MVALLLTLSIGKGRKLDSRLQRLDGKAGEAGLDREAVARLAKRALPRVGSHLIPTDEQDRTKLQTKLINAGFYGPAVDGRVPRRQDAPDDRASAGRPAAVAGRALGDEHRPSSTAPTPA